MTNEQRTTTATRTETSVAEPKTTAPDQPDSDQSDTDTLRILHVEDNPADALLMQEYLRGVTNNLHFDTATRLAELTPERAAAADCTLLDLSLPDATGLEAVTTLRHMSPNIPIIVLTGFDNLELGLTAVRDGADDYLLKSHVDGYSLERAIQYAIERRRLLLEVASSTFTAHAATTAAAANTPTPTPPPAAGTHEVSVRIDATTGDYALRCTDCTWQADRGSDTLHSWTDRSLDVVLLHHLDYTNHGHEHATHQTTAPSVARRGMFRPRGWTSSRASRSSGRGRTA
jgi:CheY-like chemotaxis protein